MKHIKYILFAALWAAFLCPVVYNGAQATVTSASNTITYTGDNSTVAFEFPYLFYDEDHLVIKVDGTTKTITTDYTVSGEGVASGGTVTFLSAPATDAAIVIQRIVPYTQNTDFTNYDGYPAEVVEKALDLHAMMASQVGESDDRKITVPVGTTLTSNDISGTIDSTTRLLTITSSGPATATVASLADSGIDTTLSSLAAGDILNYGGADWQNSDLLGNILTGSPVQGQIPYIDSSADFALLGVGTAGQFFTTGGAAANPAWKDIGDYTDTVITASDKLLFSDATDSDALKQDTVQGILDLVSAAGEYVLLATATASNSSSIQFTSASVTIDDTYEEYEIHFIDVVPATDTVNFQIRTSTDGGASFDSGASDYSYGYFGNHSGASTVVAVSSNASNKILVSGPTAAWGSDTGESFSGKMTLFDPAGTDNYKKIIIWAAGTSAAGNEIIVQGQGTRKATANIDAISFFFSSGNIESGEFKLYGINKS